MGSAHARHAGSRSWRRRRVVLLAAGVAALALVAAGCSSNSSASGSTPVKGGVAVFAEPPDSPPNYIFPFMTAALSSNVNLFDFTYLMYRPLYWFGVGSQPVFNPSLSLASAPVFNGRNVTISLKHYMWSNGTPVTAQDVMFWINMMKAVPSDWFDFTPGGFPANVSNIKVVSSTELTMTMDKAYSPTWFQYNELSQITPMPAAWDRTASGPGNCDTTVGDCAAVYNYLAGQAKDLTTYATSPVWGIVDGPWKLSAFNADGHMTFVPNKSYSGPRRAWPTALWRRSLVTGTSPPGAEARSRRTTCRRATSIS
jgi:peptide/nickel transport system substrate-binding protein